MPWRHTYEPAPKDLTLVVLRELPPDFSDDRWSFGVKTAVRRPPQPYVPNFMHYCALCQGWIEGMANHYPVNTLNGRALAGRRGTEFHCRRCGEQIGFEGIMS